MRRLALAGLATLGLATAPQGPPPATEVRQLVTFSLLPGKTDDVVALFRDRILPLYRANEAMLRFRAYREVESPEPLDLVVVSTFEGMAGMDASNRFLAEEARRRGTSLGALYGAVSALARYHHDRFVEILGETTTADRGRARRAPLRLFESIRVAPGGARSFETLVSGPVAAWEAKLERVGPVVTGRYLLADGWDYLRIVDVDSLGAVHAYLAARRRESWHGEWERLVAASRRTILRELEELAVR